MDSQVSGSGGGWPVLVRAEMQRREASVGRKQTGLWTSRGSCPGYRSGEQSEVGVVNRAIMVDALVEAVWRGGGRGGGVAEEGLWACSEEQAASNTG